MPGNKPHLKITVAVLAAMAAASCSAFTDSGPAVGKVTVEAPVTQLQVGDQTQLTARVEDKNGNVLTNRRVSWSSSNEVVATVTSAGLVNAVSLGPVTITARAGGEDGSAALAVITLNLLIDRMYVTQATQNASGSVPLVAGKSAFLRVFGRANVSNTETPQVRVRIYHNGELLETRDLSSASTSVPVTIDEGLATLSWNTLLDGSLVQPGLAVLAEIDPAGTVEEMDESDNAFPLNGVPRSISIRTPPPFRLTMVPVHFSATGSIGNVSVNNAEIFFSHARTLYPFDEVDIAIRAAYTTSLPALESDDDNGSWVNLLSELNALRIAEGGSRYYYGVVRVDYNSGIAGIAFVGTPTALGWDFLGGSPIPSGAFVMAHELGHNFSRRHAPCGSPGAVDINYPYPDGSIGAYGWNRGTGQVVGNRLPDIMGYCSGTWISDYTYSNVLSYREAQGGLITDAPETSSLLVWGSIENGVPVLEPAFSFTMKPQPPRSGAWTFEALDDAGRVVLAYPFAPDPIEDARRPASSFAFAIPADAPTLDRIRSLRITGPRANELSVREIPRVAQPGVDRSAATRVLDAVTERAGERGVELTWNAADYPAAMLRNARTGEILSIVRGGRVAVQALDPSLELLLSNGVRSHRAALRVQ